MVFKLNLTKKKKKKKSYKVHNSDYHANEDKNFRG